MKIMSQLRRYWVGLSITIFYLVTHLIGLTNLPVFADESIYIRWSQLIIDDWQRYLFFALNDGKTPLFIWLLVPFEMAFKDPLFAGRLLAVLIGLVQVWTNGYLVKILGGRTRTQWLSMILTTILPFWYFYHRQALIDSLLALTLTWTVVAAIKLALAPTTKQKLLSLPNKFQWLWLILLGISFGLSLLTKIPAILIVPGLSLWIFWQKDWTVIHKLRYLGMVGAGLFVGLLLFASLRLNPAFGQLFHRGGDFLFPVSEVLQGRWRETLPNTPSYVMYFIQYTHLILVLGFVGSLFSRKRLRLQHVLFWSAILFCLPMVLLGKVVYARYFLPGMIFLTPAVCLFGEELATSFVFRVKNLAQKSLAAVLLALALANVMASSALFMSYAMTNSDQLPLVTSDKVQYLTDWSSGHGIVQTEAFIRQQAQHQKVAVATEGFFGTLPDGLLMYFHSQPDPNVYIEGIGEPVYSIPDFFKAKAAGYDKKYLVVNSFRMKYSLDSSKLVAQFCRPFSGPCLQIWDISDVF